MKKSSLSVLTVVLAASAAPVLAQGDDDETRGAAQRLPFSGAPLGTSGGTSGGDAEQARESRPDFARELAKLKLVADSVLPPSRDHWAAGAPEFSNLRARVAAAESAVQAGGDASGPLDAAWEAVLDAKGAQQDAVVGRISSNVARHLVQAQTSLLEDTLLQWTLTNEETHEERAARDALAAWRRAVDRTLEPRRDYDSAQKVIDLVNQHGRDLKEAVNAAIREACYAHAAEHAANGGDVGELHDRLFPEERVDRISSDLQRRSGEDGRPVGRTSSGREIYRTADGRLRYVDGEPVPRWALPDRLR